MIKQTEQRHFFKGAFLLTYAGLLSKVISAGYRIPLQNITGDVGFYMYQQIYPFIGMATILALYGFPAALSKWFASQNNITSKKQRQLLFFYLSAFSFVVFTLLYVLAPFIANLMGDERLSMSIKSTAFIFLPLPMVSYLRGTFQARNEMAPTAVSQIAEQVMRVSLIIVAAWSIKSFDRSLYEVGMGASIASMSGMVVAGIVLITYNRRVHQSEMKASETKQSWTTNFSAIIGYGLVMAINHMLLLLLQLVDAFTLVPQLVNSGVSLIEAQTLKGVLDRGQPLAQLGIVGASSIALAIIPSMTKVHLTDQDQGYTNDIGSAWRFTLYLAGGATVGLIILFSEVNTLLFKEDIGTFSLQVFSITIVFAALSISTSAVLQGLGRVYRTALFVLIGVVVKWVGNIVLIPLLNITGAALATVCASFIILVLNLIQLKKSLARNNLITIPWRSFSLALVTMSGVVFTLNKLTQPIFYQINRSGQFIYVFILIFLGMLVYIKALIKWGAFTKKEYDVLPLKRFLKGSKI